MSTGAAQDVNAYPRVAGYGMQLVGARVLTTLGLFPLTPLGHRTSADPISTDAPTGGGRTLPLRGC